MKEMLEQFHHNVREGTYDEAFDVYWSGLGNALRQDGRFDEDMQVLRALFPNGEFIAPVLSDRNLGWAHLMLGLACLGTGLLATAKRHLKRAASARDTDFFHMHGPRTVGLAKCQLLLGNVIDARDLLEDFLESDFFPAGHRVSATVQLGHLATIMGDHTKAMEHLATALALIEENDLSGFRVDAKWLDAFIKRCEDDIDGVEESIKGLLDEARTNYRFKAHLLLGAVYRKRGDLSQSSEHLREADRCLVGDGTSHRFGNLMIESAKLELQWDRPNKAAEAAFSALSCAKAGAFYAIGIESELLLSAAHEALGDLDRASTLLDSASNRLARRGAQYFSRLVLRQRNAAERLESVDRERDDRDVARAPSTTIVEKTQQQYDVFISHASEDKSLVATPLVQALLNKGLNVWYDTLTLNVGDSLLEKIDEGLGNSSFGVVILSKDFFRKRWTRLELDGLIAVEGRKCGRVLPVWHKVSHDDVTGFSPILAGRLAVSTEVGVDAVADLLAAAIGKERMAGVTVSGFGVLEFDEDWELIGGEATVRAFVAEVGYNIENGITPPVSITSRGLVAARRQMSHLQNMERPSAADRVRQLALCRWLDKFSNVEHWHKEGVSWVLTTEFFSGQGYLCEESEKTRSIISLTKLFQGRSLEVANQDCTRFDVVLHGTPRLSGRVSLTKDQTDELMRSEGVDNLWHLRGGYGLTVADLPHDVIVDQAIPIIIKEVIGYRAGGAEDANKDFGGLFNLSAWSCGLA